MSDWHTGEAALPLYVRDGWLTVHVQHLHGGMLGCEASRRSPLLRLVSGPYLAWALNHGMLQELSRVGERTVENHSKNATQAGLQRMTDSLMDTQAAWTDHAFGTAGPVEQAALRAQVEAWPRRSQPAAA